MAWRWGSSAITDNAGWRIAGQMSIRDVTRRNSASTSDGLVDGGT